MSEYGLIIDLETTGLDPRRDKIIEVGAILFSLPTPENPAAISQMVGVLQDPGVPISEEVQKITGISNESVKNQKINWDYISELFQKSELIIAHNARFDRAFLAQVPELNVQSHHWACSMHHIDWRTHGYNSRSLNYLACDHGFINPFPHRALFDCATTYRLILPYMQELVDASFKNFTRVAAVGAAFETKDILRQSGYSWDPNSRCWHKTVLETKLEIERVFLSEKVYFGNPKHVETTVNFWDFSE